MHYEEKIIAVWQHHVIPYKVFPMFQIGPLRFNLYGVMFAVGILTAGILAVRGGAKRGIKKEIIQDLTFKILLGALVGARAFYLLFYWPDQVPLTFWTVFKIWEGGLAFIGGFAGGLATGYLSARRHGLKFRTVADIYSFPLIVGHILGRIGDYLTGGHPGKVTGVAWSIFLNGAPRHPVVLYEILGLLIIGGVIRGLKRAKGFDGFFFLVYVQLYAIQRIILDFFRPEFTDPRFLGLTPTQYAVMVTFLTAPTLMILEVRRRKMEGNGDGGDSCRSDREASRTGERFRRLRAKGIDR